MKRVVPLWVVLENVDLGDVSDECSNGGAVRQALEDAGYANCIFVVSVLSGNLLEHA